MRILAISDLHTDFRKHRRALEELSETRYQEDVLLVAGDIASRIEIIQATLSLLRSKFLALFYVPGNHELWVRRQEYATSIDKFFEVIRICDQIGVHTRPAKIGKVRIVPLFSWYASDFSDDGHEYAYQLQGWTDFYSCQWPEHLADNIPEYFSTLNTPHIQSYEEPVISFSHFLPRLELLPPRYFLYFKALPEVAGSPLIEKQLRQVGSTIHVFGHSHIPRDVILGGIRYVNNPLSHHRNGEHVAFPEKAIWQDENIYRRL